MKRKSLFGVLLAMFLVLVMVVGCSNSNNESSPDDGAANNVGEEDRSNEGEAAKEDLELPPMTEEEITLTYASWYSADLNEYLAEKFMEKYPNITVDLVHLEQDGWNDSLLNLASTGQLPDVFWYINNVDISIRNGWLGDFTEYFENDPETSTILTSLQDKGYFDGERKMAAPAQYFPYTIFLDENLFNKMNVDMPSPDWTYSEMIDLMREMTIPEEGIYGYNAFTRIETMAPIVNQDADGEFGWDGETYDLTGDWAEAQNLHAEFVRSGVHAPNDPEEKEAAFGDSDIWPARTGQIAMQLDAWWTYGVFNEQEIIDKGIKMVPYVVPKGDNAQTERKPAFIDFGAISSATEHPREAYELLKFFAWGKDGWETKLEAFKTIEKDDGTLMFENPVGGLPIIDDEEIWSELRTLYPDSHYYDDFLERAKEPIPLGGTSQPGFQTFIQEVLNGGEYGPINQAVINGDVDAHDIAPEFTEKINQYREEALEELLY